MDGRYRAEVAENTRPAAADELVDVIGEDGHVVDVVTRSEMRRRRLRHRCTFVVVRSTLGEVLIHRRSDDKDMWPGRWDLACGGVVGAGEDWLVAAERELAEELGIAGVPLVELSSGTFADADVDEVARAWQVHHDGPFTFTDDEVVEALFVPLDELERRLGVDRFVPDSVALLAADLLGGGDGWHPGSNRGTMAG